jgi:hypothetical protein
MEYASEGNHTQIVTILELRRDAEALMEKKEVSKSSKQVMLYTIHAALPPWIVIVIVNFFYSLS